MLNRFKGWRVGVITNEAALAKVMEPPVLPPVSHGGLQATLYRTGCWGGAALFNFLATSIYL